MNHNRYGSLEYILGTRTNGANPFKIFESLSECNADAVYWAIKRMSYQTFLGTAYWFAVASVAKSRAGMRCQVCNSQKGIEVHHRTYENHGREHSAMIDLVVLCDNCHGLFHGHKTEQIPGERFEGRVKLPSRFIVPHTAQEVEAPKDAVITLTAELIQKCRTNQNGFTNVTLRAFGLKKSLMQKGWVSRLIGKQMSNEEYKKAIEGRFIYRSGALEW